MDDERSINRVEGSSPWPDRATARHLLRHLLAIEQWSATHQEPVESGRLGPWLIREGLGPLAHARFKEEWPALASRLQGDLFLATAESSLHLERLERVVEGFAAAGLPAVLLKGAALAQSAYRDPALRPMSDVDLLVPEDQMRAAVQAMQDAGFVVVARHSRPPALQMLADGEVGFTTEEGGLVELHLSPFSGWWLQHAAATENSALWARVEPMPSRGPARQAIKGRDGAQPVAGVYQLSAEDMVIHLAVHLAVNHQFGLWPVRTLVDIAMVDQSRTVQWAVVADQAAKWRLATALWTVLHLAHVLIGLEGVQPALDKLRPSFLRRALLQRLVSPETLLAEVDRRRSRSRYLLLLLLVDRPRDMLRLIFRTLWPEREWLEARYPEGDVSRWQHLWRVIRYGEI